LTYLGFVTEGKLAAIFFTPSLGVPNWPVIYIINYTPNVFWHHSTPRHQQVFWRLSWGLKKTKLPRQLQAPTSTWHHQRSFLAPLLGKKKTSARGVSHAHLLLCFLFCFTLFLLASFYQNYKKISTYYSCYFCWYVIVLLSHAFSQWLVSLKLNVFGKVGSRKSSKIIMRNTACHKKGNTYGNKSIDCISLLEMSLQGFRSIATKLFVVINTKLLQYVPIAMKCRSLPPVATTRMVIGYRHKKIIVAIKCVIATVIW
jgi:hypothetical protein